MFLPSSVDEAILLASVGLGNIEITSSGSRRRIFPTPSHIRRTSCFDNLSLVKALN